MATSLLYIRHMRYAVKWNNGGWKLFDRFEYRDVEIYGLERDAREAADQANAQEAGRPARRRR